MRLFFLVGCFSALAVSLCGQIPNEIVSAGYATPEYQVAVAGQVLTLFVRGVSVPDASAATFPLPTSLSGLSVTVKVACCNPTTYPSLLPIFKVHSEDFCGGRNALPCPLTQVTVQIPTEPLCVQTNFPNSCTIGPPGSIVLNVNVNGVPGQDFPVILNGGMPHFLNTCDTVLVGSGICNSLVTHADGSPITAGSPAAPGETIVLYAVGLGPTNPPVPAGSPSPTPPASVPPVPISVSFRAEFSPASPPPLTYIPANRLYYSAFAGLTPGYVGLYQINFVAPTPPAQTHRCSSFGGTNTRLAFAGSSTEYVDLCVRLP